jgi:hypothetical protein
MDEDDLQAAADAMAGLTDEEEGPEEQQDAPEQPDEQPDPDAPEGEEGEGEESEDKLEPIQPPQSWDAEARAKFAELPRELQEFVTKRETERDVFLSRKANEAATTRQQVEREALAIIQQREQETAAELERYAALFTPQRPDPALLRGSEEHRALYYEQQAQYEAMTAHRQDAERQAQEARQRAQAAEQHQLQAEREAEARLLAERLPEWFEPSSGPKLQAELGSIGRELGYTPEQMQEARASDILALNKAREWKAKADRLDALNKAKMQPVRDAKKLPPVARPGAAPSQDSGRRRDFEAAKGRLKQSGSLEDAAAALSRL